MSRKNRFIVLILFVLFVSVFAIKKNYQPQQSKVTVAVVDGAVSKRSAGISKYKNYVKSTPSSERHARIVSSLLEKKLKKQKVNINIYGVIGKNGTVTAENMSKGIREAVKDNCRFINISAGVALESKELTKAIKYAQSKHIIIIAAAGNNWGGEADFPARLKSVISVGSEGNKGISKFSAAIDVSTWADGEDIYYQHKKYYGTSFSAPKVTNKLVHAYVTNKRKYAILVQRLERRDNNEKVF